MRLRGATALEMIVVMIILLVVAGVIISLFLNVFGGINPNPISAAQQFQEKVERECNTFCSSYVSGRNSLAGIEYCKTMFTFDFNEDRDRKDPFQTNTLLYACEDSFYCPQMHRCELQGGEILTLQKCKELLCSVLEEKYSSLGSDNPTNDAEQEILGLIQQGSCQIPADQPNWFDAIYDVPGEPLCP